MTFWNSMVSRIDTEQTLNSDLFVILSIYIFWFSVFFCGGLLVVHLDKTMAQVQSETLRHERKMYIKETLQVRKIVQSNKQQKSSKETTTNEIVLDVPAIINEDEQQNKGTAPQSHNAETKTKDTIPKVVDATTCSICLEEFKNGDKICQSPNCSHIFHVDGCMEEWLLRHDDCPCCRRIYLRSPNNQSNAKYVRPLHNGDQQTENFSFEDFPPWVVLAGTF